jgi:hypothetical protein
VSRRRPQAKTTDRVNEVYAMLVAGLRREAIIRLANEKHGWNVRPRTVDDYIAKAKQRFEEEARVRREAELGKAIARLDNLYAKSVSRNDNRTALAVERERIELLGLRVAHDGDLSDVDAFLQALLEPAP